jgi:hypothetical protein
VFVVEGVNADPARGWPDAVAVSALAATVERPILLVRRDALPEVTRRTLLELAVDEVTIVGGERAVSAEVAARLADPDGDGRDDVSVQRIAGGTRYETSVGLADVAIQRGADARSLWFSTGLNWPDALTAGPAVAAVGGVLVLVHGQDLGRSPASATWADGLAADPMSVRLVGGTAAVTDVVQDGIARALLAD